MVAQPPERRPRPLISVSEAARLMGKSPSFAYTLARRGELPGAVKLGTRTYVRIACLSRWLAGDNPTPAEPHE